MTTKVIRGKMDAIDLSVEAALLETSQKRQGAISEMPQAKFRRAPVPSENSHNLVNIGPNSAQSACQLHVLRLSALQELVLMHKRTTRIRQGHRDSCRPV